MSGAPIGPITALRSPNHNARPGGTVDMIVIHYTDMASAADAAAWLCYPGSGVSAHYLIVRNGTVLQLVDEDRRAWHAGHSFWRGVHDNNARAIGIELDSPGHRHGEAPAFPPAQMRALLSLLDAIRARWPVPIRNVVAHSDIAPHRKMDPGERFAWATLADAGHALATPTPAATSFSEARLWAALETIGYAPTTGLPLAQTGARPPADPSGLRALRTEASRLLGLPPADTGPTVAPEEPIAHRSWRQCLVDAFHRRHLPTRVGEAASEPTLAMAEAVASVAQLEGGHGNTALATSADLRGPRTNA